MKETLDYLLEILFDDLGMEPEDAIEVLIQLIREIAQNTDNPSRTLEDTANALAD